MKDLRTIIEIERSKELISHHNSIMFIGSCFTENIGLKLEDSCFTTQINPFGAIYNPLSVSNSLLNLINKKLYEFSDLNFNNEQWYSFDHHSMFSDSDKTKCLENINNNIDNSTRSLKNSDFLFITFGTAFVYTHKERGKIVANCHKVSDSEFERTLVDVEAVVGEYDKLIKALKQNNPEIKIVFTISPVRHWKDGAENNNLSKSILKLSIHEICKTHSNVSYFPAYEIMMDDLRDYRFYKDDMLHPNSLAIEYIWEKFSETFFETKTIELIHEINKLRKAAEHRPFNPNSNTFREFVKSNLQKLDNLKKRHPELKSDDLEQKFLNLIE